MKIVNIIGGLGNQMFQYSFAISLKRRFPKEEVLIDTSHFNYIFVKKYKSANLHNGFEINKIFPNACLDIAKPKHLVKVTWYMPNYILSRIIRRLLPIRKTEVVQNRNEYFVYNEDYYRHKGNIYYEGIWESVKYYIPIRETIQHVFSHGVPNEINAQYIKDMEACNSVAIHIRRGDYIYAPEFNNICDLDYYKRGIAEILSDGNKHTFYVFSNDMEWCKENIVPLVKNNKVIMVSENKGSNSCWDMFLMTHCKDLIIANSSFSWWGAFLNNRGGRVIAPNKWVNRNAEIDIWLNDWIKL